MNYPLNEQGPCLSNITNPCGTNGKCSETDLERSYCVCDPYYDTFSNCSKTIFEVDQTASIIYSIIGIIIPLVVLIFFILEVIGDIMKIKTWMKSTIFYTKLAVVMYAIIKEISSIFFTRGLVNNTTRYYYIEIITYQTAVVLFGSSIFLSGAHWFSTILLIKKFQTYDCQITIFKWIIIGLVCVCSPTSLILGFFNLYDIESPLTGEIAGYFTRILIVGAFLILSGNIILIFVWFCKISKSGDNLGSNKKYIILKQKTYIMVAMLLFVLLINLVLVPITNFPRELVLVLLMRRYLNILTELFTLILMYAFLQNHGFKTNRKPFVGYINIFKDKVSITSTEEDKTNSRTKKTSSKSDQGISDK